MLPAPIGAALVGVTEETVVQEDDLLDCRCLATVTPTVSEKRDSEEVLDITDEEKRLAVAMYLKGIKLHYISGLFDITNPRVIHCWGDWKRRPKYEADKNLERREQIRALLDKGESPKTVRETLGLKERVYRHLIGIAMCRTYSYSVYEEAMRQLETTHSRKTVSRNLNIPNYFLRRWGLGKGVPDKPLIEADADGTVETKRRAIIRFYETGNALSAAKLVGAATPQSVERWVVKYQKAVDERSKRDVSLDDDAQKGRLLPLACLSERVFNVVDALRQCHDSLGELGFVGF